MLRLNASGSNAVLELDGLKIQIPADYIDALRQVRGLKVVNASAEAKSISAPRPDGVFSRLWPQILTATNPQGLSLLHTILSSSTSAVKTQLCQGLAGILEEAKKFAEEMRLEYVNARAALATYSHAESGVSTLAAMLSKPAPITGTTPWQLLAQQDDVDSIKALFQALQMDLPFDPEFSYFRDGKGDLAKILTHQDSTGATMLHHAAPKTAVYLRQQIDAAMVAINSQFDEASKKAKLPQAKAELEAVQQRIAGIKAAMVARPETKVEDERPLLALADEADVKPLAFLPLLHESDRANPSEVPLMEEDSTQLPSLQQLHNRLLLEQQNLTVAQTEYQRAKTHYADNYKARYYRQLHQPLMGCCSLSNNKGQLASRAFADVYFDGTRLLHTEYFGVAASIQIINGKLNLRNRYLLPQDAPAIAAFLKANPTITSVDLSNNNLGGVGCKMILDALAGTAAAVNLTNNGIADVHAVTILQGLRQAADCTVDLSDNELGAEFVWHFGKFIDKKTEIAGITLSGNSLTNADIASIRGSFSAAAKDKLKVNAQSIAIEDRLSGLLVGLSQVAVIALAAWWKTIAYGYDKGGVGGAVLGFFVGIGSAVLATLRNIFTLKYFEGLYDGLCGGPQDALKSGLNMLRTMFSSSTMPELPAVALVEYEVGKVPQAKKRDRSTIPIDLALILPMPATVDESMYEPAIELTTAPGVVAGESKAGESVDPVLAASQRALTEIDSRIRLATMGPSWQADMKRSTAELSAEFQRACTYIRSKEQEVMEKVKGGESPSNYDALLKAYLNYPLPAEVAGREGQTLQKLLTSCVQAGNVASSGHSITPPPPPMPPPSQLTIADGSHSMATSHNAPGALVPLSSVV